jgi:hypothetical protein
MKTLLLAVAMLASAATSALADPPWFGNSTLPNNLLVVGNDGAGTPDPAGRYLVTVRDLANNPAVGVSVTFDWSTCPGLRLCTNQNQPGLALVCGGTDYHATLTTDAQGQVAPVFMGGRDPLRGAPTDRVRVYADGGLLASVNVAVFDLDGRDGVGAGDLSLWLQDFGTGLNWGRCDYDGNAFVGSGDLSVWLTVFGSGHSAASCGSATAGACP